MAGLTKTELAGKTAYLASSDPPPEAEWKELTQEEKDQWIAAAEGDPPPTPAPKEPIPPCPPMTIEQGDKTPAVLEWRAKYQSAK